MIPEQEIQELKQNIDFLSLTASYGLTPIKKGQNYFISCPFHKEETASLSIDSQKNLFQCFGCGEKGNVIQFVQKMENLDFRGAVRRLQGSTYLPTASQTLEPSNPELSKEERQTLIESAFASFQSSFASTPNGKQYLLGRGIATFENVGYCPKDFASKLSKGERDKLKSIGLITSKGYPLFANCVVFPLVSPTGKVLSLYGRKTSGKGDHYYLPGQREGLFYSKKNSSSVIVVESVIDALTLISKGFKDVLALYGVNGYTPQHAQFLESYKTIHLLLDGDKTGKEASAKLSKQLKEKGKAINQITLPNEEDPNSFLQKGKQNTSWLKDQLDRVNAKASSFSLTAEGDNYIAQGERLTYTLQGLSLTGLDKMRITFKVSLNVDPSIFHIDNIDLYNAKQRAKLAEGVATELGVKEDKVLADLKTITVLLEKERLKAKEDDGKESVELSTSEKQEALEALQDPKLIDNLLKSFEISMIGEEQAKLVGYLGTVSRLLDEPLGVLIVSRSGAGKTTLQDAICSFVPDESLEQYTRLTGQALFYHGQDGLKNKVLAIEEEEGMQEAIYAIRTLQSSQRLCVVTTKNDPKTGKFATEKYTVEGPVFILISTTNPDSMDYETRNRFVILTIDESEAQTVKIMDARKHAYTLEGRLQNQDIERVKRLCTNMQRLLKPIEVVNNYAPFLEYPFDKLQMRREFKKYMTLVNSIALLHQYQREIKTYTKDNKTCSYIEVDVSDIALANKLVLKFFPNAIDELAPHTRSLGLEVSKLVEEKEGDIAFTRKELRDFSGWSDWQVREGLKQLEELEYISKISGRNGSRIVYEMLVDVREDKRQSLMLTDPKELEKMLRKKKSA